ncbi:MAG: hypothetical protein LBG50_04780 [Clostridiales Family XIII bacterium]|jgi:sugar O-acyltransferase (sialic acid O-acetyltransferase NeuD family)|nr:hypothetical protein [Clostridiales Family XIII bacterium]
MKNIYIIGAGGFGREVADTVCAINMAAAGAEQPYRIVGFIDEDESKWGTLINGIEVKGGLDWLRISCTSGGLPTAGRPYADKPGADTGATDMRPAEAAHAVIAIADPKAKRAMAEKLGDLTIWETIIHPTAVVSPHAIIEAGTVIQANAFVSADAHIGGHCCVNCLSSIGHDAVLGDCVSVMSHCDITGGVRLADDVYVATSVAVIPEISVGKGAFIGAGSVVLKNVDENTRMLGYPARRIG